MKIGDEMLRRTADWLMSGTPSLRSVAAVRCERILEMSAEEVNDLIKQIEDGMGRFDVIGVLREANGG